MVLLGGAEIWTTCWADPAPTTFHWQESPFTTKKIMYVYRHQSEVQNKYRSLSDESYINVVHPLVFLTDTVQRSTRKELGDGAITPGFFLVRVI